MRIDTRVDGKVTNKTMRYKPPIDEQRWQEIGQKREDVKGPKPWKIKSRSTRVMCACHSIKGGEHKKRQMEKSIDVEIDPRVLLPSKSKSAGLKEMHIDYEDEIVILGR